MGKNYAENSLKRFLKRKVKITLGLVVTFLITGMVAFAEGTAEKSEIVVKLEEQQGNYTTAKENLEGLGAKIFENESSIETDNGYSITVKKSGEEGTTKNIKLTRKDGKTTIDASDIKSNVKFSFDDRLVSEKVQKNIENALTGTEEGQGKYKVFTSATSADNRKYAVNNGIVIHENKGSAAQVAGVKTDGTVIDTVINNGVFFSPQGVSLNAGKAINNGVIYSLHDTEGGGQSSGVNIIDNVQIPYENAELYNNGLIVSKYSGQDLYKSIGAKIYNNGVISSEKYGQTTRATAESIKIYNYGIMETKLGGQYIVGGTNSILENYGTIVTEGVGQYTNGNTNKAYNYGLIKVTDGYAMSGAGAKYNYGVIKASENSSIFSSGGTTVSKGIIIGGDSSHLTKYMENSAVFDTDYKLQNTNAKIISGKLSGNEFKEGENLAVIQNNRAELNGIFNDKTIASVVTDDIQKPVFTLGEGETVLNNTNLVGYFENNNGGTLLKVDADKTLTLDGKTNITAVKDLTSETKDVYALSLEKGSTLNLIGSDVKVNGIINGLTDTTINAYAVKGDLSVDTSGKLLVGNIQGDITSDYVKSQNVTDVTISKNNETQTIKDLEFNFTNTTAKDENGKLKENNVTIADGVSIAEGGTFTDKTEAGNDVRVEIENLENFAKNLDSIKLGAGNNTLVIKNANDNISAYAGTIGMGTSENDEFKVKYNSADKINEFKYNVKNAETVSLSGGTWKIGDKGNIGFDKVSKAGNTPNINMADNSTLNITLNQKGSDLSEILKAGKVTNGEHLVLSTDDTSKIKYIISDEGIKHETLSTDTYSIDKNANVVAPIFNVSQTGNGGVQMSVKTAEEAGVGEYKPIYDAFVGAVTNGNAEKDVIDKINSMTSNEDIGKLINNTNVAATAYYTAGTVVTKNIIDSYSSAVENFGRRAEKGEWIAEGKFINSDTEFDGGSKVRGYEGDINSAVAMVEYGVSDTTSYGVAFGGGDTEVDINGGGKLDGNNYYVGAYMKHRTTNGVDVVANVGFVKSDLDSKLSNDFKLTEGKVDISGSSLVDGTADSNALAVSLRGRKDFQVTDSIKLQPNLGARVTMISQDEASNPDMGFEVKAQDIFVVEGIVGFDVAKEFALADGKVELRAGVEYTALSSNQDHDAEYTLYGSKIELEDSELASTVGNAHVGVNYEHENGVGFNGKYEMMWSDSGDDSRITAGVSYRF